MIESVEGRADVDENLQFAVAVQVGDGGNVAVWFIAVQVARPGQSAIVAIDEQAGDFAFGVAVVNDDDLFVTIGVEVSDFGLAPILQRKIAIIWNVNRPARSQMTVQPDEAGGKSLHGATGVGGRETEGVKFIGGDERGVKDAERSIENFAIGGNAEACGEPFGLREAARPFQAVAAALAENGSAQDKR